MKKSLLSFTILLALASCQSPSNQEQTSNPQTASSGLTVDLSSIQIPLEVTLPDTTFKINDADESGEFLTFLTSDRESEDFEFDVSTEESADSIRAKITKVLKTPGTFSVLESADNFVAACETGMDYYCFHGFIKIADNSEKVLSISFNKPISKSTVLKIAELFKSITKSSGKSTYIYNLEQGKYIKR